MHGAGYGDSYGMGCKPKARGPAEAVLQTLRTDLFAGHAGWAATARDRKMPDRHLDVDKHGAEAYHMADGERRTQNRTEKQSDGAWLSASGR